MFNRLLFAGVLLLTTVWYPAVPKAQVDTVNQLLAYCHDGDKIKENYCLGYINGLVQASEAYLGILSLNCDWIPRFCMPLHAISQQMANVLVQWLQRHPEQRHEASVAIIQEALAEVFPCRQ